MPHVARLVPSRTPQTYSSDLVLLLSPSLARFSPGLRRVPELPRFVWNVTAPGTSLAVGPASAARVRLRQGGARLRQLAWTAGLWVRLFNAKKDAADGGGPQLDRLETRFWNDCHAPGSITDDICPPCHYRACDPGKPRCLAGNRRRYSAATWWLACSCPEQAAHVGATQVGSASWLLRRLGQAAQERQAATSGWARACS